MAMQFPAEQRKQLSRELNARLEERTIAELRRMAQLWRWSAKGTAKAAIIQTLAANLTDASIMAPAFSSLPSQEQLLLTLLTLIRVGGNAGPTTARMLSGATGTPAADTEAFNLFSDLVARGLVYFDNAQGYTVPPIFREWLPPIAPPGIRLSGAQRLETRPGLSAAALGTRVEDLLYAIGAERPTLLSRPNLPKPTEVTPRPGPFSADVLDRWGFDSSADKDLARFLLMALVHGKLIESPFERPTAIIQVDATALAGWSSLAPAEQRVHLNRFWHVQPAQSSLIGLPLSYRWNEIDLALEHLRQEHSPYHLTRSGYVDAVDYAIEGIALQLRILLSGIVGLLAQDTWYSFEAFCRLIRGLLPDLLFSPSLGRVVQWSEKTQKLTSDTMLQPIWQATYGELIAAWLTGPAAWLGLVEVAFDRKHLVAFRRPAADAPTEHAKLPGDALRFEPDGRLTLRTYPQAADLRAAVRQIARLEARDHRQLAFRLDPGVFRSALERGATAAQIIQSFARFGFPLPQALGERITAWERRAGRFHLYEQVAAVEFGDALAPREVQAALDLRKLEALPASPQCLLILNPDAVPSMVDDLRRRGYLPKVIS